MVVLLTPKQVTWPFISSAKQEHHSWASKVNTLNDTELLRVGHIKGHLNILDS